MQWRGTRGRSWRRSAARWRRAWRPTAASCARWRRRCCWSCHARPATSWTTRHAGHAETCRQSLSGCCILAFRPAAEHEACSCTGWRRCCWWSCRTRPATSWTTRRAGCALKRHVGVCCQVAACKLTGRLQCMERACHDAFSLTNLERGVFSETKPVASSADRLGKAGLERLCRS